MTWERTSPRSWRYRDAPSDQWVVVRPYSEIECLGFGRWVLHINRRFIAEFKTWDEASGCAPMLIKLYKSEHGL